MKRQYEVIFHFDETVSREDFSKIKVAVPSISYMTKADIVKQAKKILDSDGWIIEKLIVYEIIMVL